MHVHSDAHYRRLSNASQLGYTSLRQMVISLGNVCSGPGELLVSALRTADEDAP